MGESESEKCLAVTTWGNPRGWWYSRYVYEELGQKFDKYGFSTLNLLMEVERPDIVLLLALDTLSSLKERVYNSIKKEVEDYIRSYLCVENKIAIEILPGILSSKKEAFKADLGDYELLALNKIFHEGLKLGGNKLRIALDITHGVNYMPVLTYSAALEAASMLAVTISREVDLRIYQADPVYLEEELRRELSRQKDDPCKPNGRAEPPELRYNLLRRRKVSPWELTRYLSYSENNASKLLTDPRDCSIKDSEILYKKVLPLLGAFRIGALPELCILAKSLDPSFLRNIINEALQCWNSKRVVKEGNVLELVSNTRLSEGFRALLHALALVTGVMRNLESESACSEARECTTTLEEIKKLRRLLNGSKVIETLVNREISKLEHIKQKICPDDWTLYSEYKSNGGDISRSGNGKFTRDFIAHAGFHNEVLLLRKSSPEKDLEIKIDEGQLDKVLEILRKQVLI
jgi:CRISPR-associated protein Csx1